MPIEEAHVPVLDRGFIFGDGVYEVVPVYSRHPFRLAEHLRRLQHSLDGVRIANPHSDAEWTQLISEIDRSATPATTSRSTCRSRAAWPSATTRSRKTSRRRCS